MLWSKFNFFLIVCSPSCFRCFSIAFIDIVSEIVKKFLTNCTLRVWPVPEAIFALFNLVGKLLHYVKQVFSEFFSLCIAKGRINGRCRIREVQRLSSMRVVRGRREAFVERVRTNLSWPRQQKDYSPYESNPRVVRFNRKIALNYQPKPLFVVRYISSTRQNWLYWKVQRIAFLTQISSSCMSEITRMSQMPKRSICSV